MAKVSFFPLSHGTRSAQNYIRAMRPRATVTLSYKQVSEFNVGLKVLQRGATGCLLNDPVDTYVINTCVWL